MKKFLIPVSIVVLIGAVVYALSRNNDQGDDNPREQVAGVSVETVAQRNEVRVPVKFTGQIKSKQATTIRAQVEGVLQSLPSVGSGVVSGTPLLRISNPSVEAAYQNALNAVSIAQANLAQTQASAQSQENQARIAVSEAQAALELARQSVLDAQTSGDLNVQKVRDSALATYDSAYNTLESTMRYLGGANLNQFVFADVLNANQDVHTQAINQFVVAKEKFLALNRFPQSDLETALNLSEQTIFAVDQLNDLTAVLLSYSVAGVGFEQNFLANAKTQTAALQASLNSADAQVKSSRNAIRDTRTQRDIAVRSAQKQVEIAELRLESTRSVLSSQSVSSKQQTLAASSQLSSANAQLAAARHQYDNLQVPSPFAGTVISHKSSIGSQVSFGQEIVEIGDLNIIEVRIQINPEEANALRLGQEVLINGLATGRIIEIEPAADLNTGLVGVLVAADNFERRFGSGSVAEVELELVFDIPGVIVVPLKVVQVGQNTQTLSIIVDDRAVLREVKLGRVFGPFVEIVSGLAEGERVIVENQAFLDEGDLVRIIEN